MSKKNLIIILIIIVVLLILAGLFIGVFSKLTKEESVPSRYLEICNGYGVQKAKDDCLLNFAIEKKDNNLCGAIYSDTQRTVCNALFTSDISACKVYDFYLLETSCLLGISIVQEDPSICDSIPEIPDSVGGVDQREKFISDCRDAILFKQHKCDQLLDENKVEKCKYDKALKEKDISFCNTLIRESSKEDCLINMAVEKMNCEELDTLSFKDMCYSILASKEKNENFCQKIQGVGQGREKRTKDTCLLALALKKVRLEVCNMIDDVSLKESCQVQVESKKRRLE